MVRLSQVSQVHYKTNIFIGEGVSDSETTIKSFPKALNVLVTSYIVDVIDLFIATDTVNLREMHPAVKKLTFAMVERVSDSSATSQLNNLLYEIVSNVLKG